MDNISIKDHPPWYARGTPVIKTRDGPAMALSDKPLLAICRGPSGEGRGKGKGRGRGKGQGRGGSQQLAVGSWKTEVGSRPPASPKDIVWRERNCRAGKSEDASSKRVPLGERGWRRRSRGIGEEESRNPIAVGSEVGSRPPASPKDTVWRERNSRAGNPDSRGEERSREEPKRKTRRWLTLNTTFFNTQNSVSSQ